MQLQERTVKPRLSRRTVFAMALVLLAIPALLAVGIFLLEDRSYYLISLSIILLSMVPFALAFEGRKPQARELVIVAVLVAIAVAGRAAFFMIPQFKPVMAIVIISGVALGGECGFVVGALSAFLSNLIFGHGPWTPWQMFAFGIVGFLAGVLTSKGLLKPKRIPLSIFGALSAFAIYGLIMDTSSALMYTTQVTWGSLLAMYATGLSFNIIHGAATAVFLLAVSQPMIEKLTRIKIKYGLMEP